MKQALRCLTIVAAVTASGTALAQQSGSLPKIRVLATGGTIAGAQASASDYGYKSGAYDVNALSRPYRTWTSWRSSPASRWRASAART